MLYSLAFKLLVTFPHTEASFTNENSGKLQVDLSCQPTAYK